MNVNNSFPFDREQARRFLNFIIDPAIGCAELRIFRASFERNFVVADQRFSKTIGGWYSDISRLLVDLSRLKGVSAYITVNPVDSDLLSRIDHEIHTLRKDMATKDEDIEFIRNLYVDIDPNRPADISATQEEVGLALAVRDAILTDHPAMARSSIWGCSGNGGFITPRLPNYPNDAEHKGLVAKALAILSEFYGKKAIGRDDRVTVDVTTKNPSRVMVIPGTMKCKGANRAERPWRLATIDSPVDRTRDNWGVDGPSGRNVPSFDLKGWVAEQEERLKKEGRVIGGEKERRRTNGVGTAANGHSTEGNSRIALDDARMDARILGYGQKALTDETAKLNAATEGERNKQLNKSTFKLSELIESGALTADQVTQAMTDAARSIGLPEHEIQSTLDSGMRGGVANPRPRAEIIAALTERDAREEGNGYIPPIPHYDTDQNGEGEDHRRAPPPTQGRRRLPEIICRDTSLSLPTDQALDALGRNNNPPDMFDFGGALSWIKITSTKERRAFIENLSMDAVRNRLSKICRFIEIWQTRHGESEVEVFPPVAIVRAVVAQKKWDEKVAPPLEMLVESPRFLPGGKLLTIPGYNKESCIYYSPSDGLDIGEIPEIPSEQQVSGAKGLIFDEYLHDFPFDDDSSKANALACMLLPFVRIMIDGPTPLHVFEAATEGTGKGKLANACAYPSIGRELSSTSQKEDEAEWRKMLTTTLQTGGSHIYIDNLYNPKVWDGSLQPIDSANLALALTQPEWVDRILGSNRLARIKIQCIWMASGNNLEWSKELARRVVSIRLKVPNENPFDRKGFRCEPDTLEEWAMKNRNQLLTACLTLCQQWVASGMPFGSQRMGSYENYSKTMGGILDACGVKGFLGNRGKNVSKSRESIRWPAFIEKWSVTYGEKMVSASDLYLMIFGGWSDPSGAMSPGARTIAGCPDLQIAFADIVGEKSVLSQKQKLGRAMAKQEDRVYGLNRVVRCDETSSTGNTLFRLERIIGDSMQVVEEKGNYDEETPF